jgi:signal transduction histidine kinase
MTDTPPPPNDTNQRAAAISGILGGIHQLGSAADQFFSRLYRGLHRRAQNEQHEATRRQLEVIRDHHVELRRVVHEREREIERLSSVLATLDEGIIMQDLDGRIVLLNKAARNLLGIGSHKTFWDSELGAMFDQHRHITSGENEITPVGDLKRVQVNNKILGAQLAVVFDEQGMRIGTMIVLRDVTREALAERLKNQFVLGISHELNTPMQVIKGASELIANSPEGQAPNRRYLELLTRNVDILNRMVVELLDLSEMGAGNLEIRQDVLPIETLVWGVVNGATPEVKKAKQDISVMMHKPQELYVQGDEQRLRWALGHLVQNASRYTERNGRITVMVSRAVAQDDQFARIVIQVADNGVGISDKDLQHIFEQFYRGEPRTTSGKLLDPRGLGQGLFIARTVAESHGGYIRAQTEVGKGSVFTMVLPQADASPRATPALPASE